MRRTPGLPPGRAAVHAAARGRLGAAHPRQEGPTDLRLVPPALATWATAAVLLDATAWWVAGIAVACTAVALVLLVARRRGVHAQSSGPERRPRLPVAAVLLCVAAAAVAAGLHGADVRRGPVPALARQYASVTAEVEVTSDPRLTRPRIRGDHAMPASVVMDAEVRRVEQADGTAVATRTPVLVIVDVARRTGTSAVAMRSGTSAVARRAATSATAEGSGKSAMAKEPVSSAMADVSGTSTVAMRSGMSAVTEGSGTSAVARRAATSAMANGPGKSVMAREPGTSAVARRAATSAMAKGSGTPAVAPGGTGPATAAQKPSPWLELLPSTRLRVHARSAPAAVGGDRIAGVLRVRGQAVPEVVRGPSGTQRFAGRLRAGLRKATDGLPADARALLPGLVVGDTSRITPELDAAFKETDLAHLLAVSGSNLTIILALLIGPPGTAQRVERRGLAPRLGIPLRTTAVLGGALTLGFVVVCRPDPSVLRAAACGSVVLLALATGRRRSLVPALATAVLLLVLYDPWLARSYGFLLSVLATGALLTLAPRWSEALRRRRVPPRLAEALAAAAAAQVLCAPVVAVLSARVSLVAVPCNLLAELAVAPATVLGFAALATAPVLMPLAKVCAWCASWPAGWIADIARTGAALPGGGVDWPGSWTGAALLALVTLVVLAAGRRLLRHPWLCAACGVLLVLFVVQPPPLTRVITGWPPPGWRFAMCDVGQGDASVLAAGDGSGVVVDAGPDPALVDHCLRTLGITRIPLVVLTHFHADHVAGLPGVLRGRSVGAIETTGFEAPADQAEFVRKEAAARHIPLTRATAGEQRRTGALSWRVLWPPPRPAPDPDGPNDASIVLLVRSAGLRFLLLGDLEPPAQQELLRSPQGALLTGVDVLKVAHHGSAYQDPELIRRVAPRLALISCGRNNMYGHPAPSTVAALRAEGAVVLRTDRDGALAVTGAGKELRVATD